MRDAPRARLALAVFLLAAGACSGGDAAPDGVDAGTDLLDATVGDDTGLDAGSSLEPDAFAGDDAGAPGCGAGPACEAPFTCGAGGYCVSATGVPAFEHVYVAIFENRSLTSVRGHAPYLDGLAAAGASASNYVSIGHPSLPNYIAMTSGDTWGDMCDCDPGATHDCSALTCSIVGGFCSCEHDVTHLADQLEAAGISWREYGEGMGTPCHAMDVSATHYAARHLPFLYYANVLSDATRCADHVRDFADFAGDLGSYRFTMISPNLCSDMHDLCGGNPVAHGDDWASANLAPILTQPGFAEGGRDVLFVVWDEEDNSIGSAPIPFIVVSPLATAGSVTAMRYDHYALLATWEDGLGLDRLGHAVGAPAIADIWR